MKKFKKPGSSRGNERGVPRGGGKGPRREERAGPRGIAGRPGPQSSQPAGRCVVGIHAVRELLKVRPRTVSQLWIRGEYPDHPDLAQLHDEAKSKGVRVATQSTGTLDRIVSAHQGIVAFSEEQPEIDWRALEKSDRAVLVALDEVEDPHNLGAILRTAWLLGADGVLTPEHRSAYLSPAVSKVAQGAVEHVPVEADNALGERLKRLKEHGFWVLGLSHEAKQDLFSLDIPQKVVWVLGSEAAGMRKSTEGACDDLISIPQAAPEASYNVSVAAAMALSETFRQRRGGS